MMKFHTLLQASWTFLVTSNATLMPAPMGPAAARTIDEGRCQRGSGFFQAGVAFFIPKNDDGSLSVAGGADAHRTTVARSCIVRQMRLQCCVKCRASLCRGGK